MRRVLLCTLVLVLLPSSGYAQKFFSTRYRAAQGLPANEVRAVTRDSIGFLWIATDNGPAIDSGHPDLDPPGTVPHTHHDSICP